MRPYSILLIDDEESIRLSLTRQLKKAGYAVTSAENGEQGLEIMRSRGCDIDIIITDLMMEGIDGIKVLEMAKQLKPEVGVIVLTGFGSMQTVMEAMRFGAYDYLLKPCDQNDLILRISKCAERIELENQIRQHTQEMEVKNKELQSAIDRFQELEIALRESVANLAESNSKLQALSIQDWLTGIANRRYFDDYLNREWNLAIRNSIVVSLIFIDVDYFKAFNDIYGHQGGDDCLQQIAKTINSALKRPSDLAARYGGEEFVAILPGTDTSGAVGLAEEIRRNVEKLEIPHSGSSVCKYVTISLGIGTITPSQNSTPEELVKLADDALYKAKNNGRNRIEIMR